MTGAVGMKTNETDMITACGKTWSALTLDERKSGLAASLRRKTESLDWKKIASIDIDTVVQTANIELVDELISQIVYCRPDTEFDSQNSNSGLIKVFKLSQLITEHLLYCQEVLQNKYQKAAERCSELEADRMGQIKEIQALKDTLAAAKKELRRRKELLANAQSEVIRDNKDEFDPCPYCSKKFLTTAYLLSHMQRRHQGLPLQPVLPASSMFHGFAPRIIENEYSMSVQSSPRRFKLPQCSHPVTQETQTDKSDATAAVVNADAVAEMIEKCLHEKFKQPAVQQPDQVNEIGKVSQTVQTDVNIADSTQNKPDDAESMRDMISQLKNQLDLQWQHISGKFQNGHLQEGSSEPGEINSLQFPNSPSLSSIPTVKTPSRDVGVQLSQAESEIPAITPMKLNEEVEERLQKQQNDLELLKTQLQSKVDHDLAILESKLESQERYWRSKLRNVEEEYTSQLSKLRDDLQESIEKSRKATPAVTPSTQNAHVQVSQAPETGTDESSEYTTDSLAMSSQALPHNLDHDRAHYNTNIPTTLNAGIAHSMMAAHVPVAKLREGYMDPGDNSSRPVAKPRNAYIPVVQSAAAEQASRSPGRPVYDEPEDIIQFDQVEEYSESEEQTDFSSEEVKQHRKPETKVVSIRMLSQAEDELERMEAMKSQVMEEMSNQLRLREPQQQAFIVQESKDDETEEAERRASLRRKSLSKESPDFGRMRDTLRREKKIALLEKNIQELQPTATPEKAGRSPLVKMFSAVKTSGKRMQKRVKSAMKKTPKSPAVSKTEATKGGFFSRARWRKRNSPLKTPEKRSSAPNITVDISEPSESESESEYSSGQDEVEVHHVPKAPQFSSTPIIKAVVREQQNSSSAEDASPLKVPNDAGKRKLKVRTNKAAKLRYRESRRNSRTASLVRRSSIRSKQESMSKKGSTLKKPVRRSLQAEFDNVTPENKPMAQVHESGDEATDDEVTSSWDEEEIFDGPEIQPNKPKVAEKPNLGQKKDEIFTPKGPRNDDHQKVEPNITTQRRFSGSYSPKIIQAELRPPVVARPITARPRIAMDSWDNEDDDDESDHMNMKVQRPAKPSFITQRWNDQPVHSNVGGKRTPMDVFSAVPKAKPRPATAKRPTTDPRDSPLNNSWDSGV